RLVLRVADSDVPLQSASGFSDAVGDYLDDVKKLADEKRQEAETQSKLLSDRAFQLAADPTKSSGVPIPLIPVPHLEFADLENAVDRLKASADGYDDALENN